MPSGIHTDGTLHDVSINVPTKAESPKTSKKLEGSRPTRHPQSRHPDIPRHPAIALKVDPCITAEKQRKFHRNGKHLVKLPKKEHLRFL